MSERLIPLKFYVTPEVRKVMDFLTMDGESHNGMLERVFYDYIRMFPHSSTGMEVTSALEMKDQEIKALSSENMKLKSIIQDLDAKANVRTVLVTRTGKLVKTY